VSGNCLLFSFLVLKQTHSDGVHDNFDPQELGFLPEEVGLSDIKTWIEAEKKCPQETEKIKTNYRINSIQEYLITLMEEKKVDALSVNDITTGLLQYCEKVTEKSRSFMETTGKRLPSDFKNFPGKLDHTTCISFLVKSPTKSNC
jgi:hypothetical protein